MLHEYESSFTMTPIFRNYIAKDWCDSSDRKTFENRNPANWNEMLGTFPLSTREDVNHAAKAALEAFRVWRLVPAPERGDIMRRAGEIMLRRKNELAEIMTREMGKPLTETKGDVQKGSTPRFIPQAKAVGCSASTRRANFCNKLNLSFRIPIGVCGLITPWNFPMAIPSWNLFPGLVAGNTFVFQTRAEDTPWTANMLVEILIEAGLPKGCLNLVHGSGEIVGAGITEHPLIRAVSFTGCQRRRVTMARNPAAY